jgi:hypothetical protein
MLYQNMKKGAAMLRFHVNEPKKTDAISALALSAPINH